MSAQKIRSVETDDDSELVNEDGERLIQMLSVIASNVDRSYPDGTEDSSPGTATIVSTGGTHTLEQVSNLLTAITVPSSSASSVGVPPTVVGAGEVTISSPAVATMSGVIPTVVQVDPTVAMVQQEVVVGTPDLGLTDQTEVTISMQPLADGGIALSEEGLVQQLPDEPSQTSDQHHHHMLVEKRMIFMTNYRDYTIKDRDGKIWIGRRGSRAGVKVVPVTDVSTGHTFEYEYRARGTVKRFEDRRMVIYFIGQISNERILALFYQTVFQLVCGVGRIDLDKDYTSGRRVLSTYFSAFSPSQARTMRTPIEKLTYMKLLIVGDVSESDEEHSVVVDGEEDSLLPTVKPSEKLRRSAAYKEAAVVKTTAGTGGKTVPGGTGKSPRGRRGRRKRKWGSEGPHEGDIDEEDVTMGLGKGAEEEGQSAGDVGEAAPQRLPPGSRGGECSSPRKGTPGKDADGVSLGNEHSASALVLDRGTNKRKIKRPSKLMDYFDFTKKGRSKDGLEDDPDLMAASEGDEGVPHPSQANGEVALSEGSDQSPSRWTQGVRQASVLKVGSTEVVSGTVAPSGTSLPEIDDELRLIASSSSSSSPRHPEAPVGTGAVCQMLEIIRTQEEVPQDGEEQEEEATPQEPSDALSTSLSLPPPPAPPAPPPKKRGRGRPRKNPLPGVPAPAPREPRRSMEGVREDIDELVLQRKKYPSCQFQRAQALKRTLCQTCLTSCHRDPVPEGASPEACPIVYARHCFKDQAAGEAAAAAGGGGAAAAAAAAGGAVAGACSLMSLPTSLSVKVSAATRQLTVCAGQDISEYTEFGPLVGILLTEDDIHTDTDLSHVWFLQHDEDGEKFFLYTGDENASNWCHYLRPVVPGEPYNMVMVLRDEGIFFTSCQRIAAGRQLRVHVPYFGSKTRPVATMSQSECLHCKRSFGSSLDYQKHYHIFHPGGFTKQKQRCRLCNLTFPALKDLQQHMDDKHDGQGAFQCDECPGTFPNPARVRIHKRDVHPPPEAAVPCEKCGKMYRSKRALANHNTNVHSEFKFACEVCGKWFDRRSTLLRHQRMHTGKHNHFCERCGKGFRDLHNLKVHTLTHSGVRPFSCNFCTNCSFSTRTCLKLHYERFHSLTEQTMPELTRSIPFTLEAYSGNLPNVERPAARRQPGSANLKSGKLVQSKQSVAQKLTTAPTEFHGDVRLLPGQSLLRPQPVQADPQQQMEEASQQQQQQQEQQQQQQEAAIHMEQVMGSSGSEEMSLHIPMVVEEMPVNAQLVETDHVTDGDHCYYALNVDGQQVLVPATEEVCVIVENDNIITVPANKT